MEDSDLVRVSLVSGRGLRAPMGRKRETCLRKQFFTAHLITSSCRAITKQLSAYSEALRLLQICHMKVRDIGGDILRTTDRVVTAVGHILRCGCFLFLRRF